MQGSSFQSADLAAMRAVRRAEPPPPEFRMSEFKGELPVVLEWNARR